MNMDSFFDFGFGSVPGSELPQVRIVETPSFVTDEEPRNAEDRTLLEVLADMNECLRIASNDSPLATFAFENCDASSVKVDVTDTKGCDLITTELTPESQEEHGFIAEAGEGIPGEGP